MVCCDIYSITLHVTGLVVVPFNQTASESQTLVNLHKAGSDLTELELASFFLF
jgi:hypothetical protein